MGEVPEPPSGTSSAQRCTRAPSCPADLHYVGCERAKSEMLARLAKAECSNSGHEWVIHRAWGTDLPFAATCDRCGKSLKMVER